MSTMIAFSKGLTPFHIILANPGFPLGGLSAASKTAVNESFRDTDQFLAQVLIPKNKELHDRRSIALAFVEKMSLPVMAKPDRGVVGIGVRRIDTIRQIDELLNTMPSDYMLQEYCDYPFEYGIFFCKFPNKEKGRVVSLTQKVMPQVKGDGRKTVRELIEIDPDIRYNKSNLMAHAKNPDYIPRDNQYYQVLDQASHTYGCVFKDRNHEISPDMDAWMNTMCANTDGFYFGRFDMKLKDRDSLGSGAGVKICEVNGCWSEPIHIYDDDHSLAYAAKEMFHSYSRAYRIAKLNYNRLNPGVPFGEIMRAYRSYMQEKAEVMKLVG